ncbi:MAG: MCE family protein [Deltaproteobacteria bacterium]|nr:MCE family protein [Deltaproteobacteria bacterium]
MKLNNETKVGLMITISFTITILLVALLAKINISRSGYSLKVYFGFLNGLSQGAPVKIAGGIKVGHVKSIKQSDEKSEVILWIDKQYKLIKVSKFAIFTSGLIGEKYINIFVPPSNSVSEFLADGDKIYGTDPASFDQMMLTFQGFMQDQSGGELLADIFQNSKKFVENLNRITGENRSDVRSTVLGAKSTVATLSSQIKILMDHLNKLSQNMVQITDKNREEFSVTMKNLSELSKNLNNIAYRLESGKGTIGKLLVDEQVYNNMLEASIHAKDLFKVLKKDPSKIFFKKQKSN